MWCAHDISMSLKYTGMSRREEVATLVSSFSIQVSKLYKQTKWPMWLEIIPSLRSAFGKHKE
jgi:hypothetical protein